MTQSPYKNPAIHRVYDLLFCDDIALYRDGHSSPEIEPWKTLFEAEPDEARLIQIVDSADEETRTKILAVNALRSLGLTIETKRLFGVIVEVGMDEGLDVVAAYEDGSARYINYSEKLVVWDTETTESKEIIDTLFNASKIVVDQIGPWDGERLGFVAKGNVRMTFLVSDGLYFGEGPFPVLANDPMGGPVIDCAARLMEFLIRATNAQSA